MVLLLDERPIDEDAVDADLLELRDQDAEVPDQPRPPARVPRVRRNAGARDEERAAKLVERQLVVSDGQHTVRRERRQHFQALALPCLG